jgi:hypothetical protein
MKSEPSYLRILKDYFWEGGEFKDEIFLFLYAIANHSVMKKVSQSVTNLSNLHSRKSDILYILDTLDILDILDKLDILDLLDILYI